MCLPINRSGLTLVELLISLAMMAMLAAVLGGLAMAVDASTEYSYGHATATQHARVSLERIVRNVSDAMAVEEHAAFAVLCDQVGGYRFPDTLVVWLPSGAPANAAGPPLIRELVIYCPNPADPRQLLEITAPGDARSVPLNAQLNQSPWKQMIEDLKTTNSSQKVVLTDLLRTAAPSGGNLRGAVRFEQEIRPSATSWAQYKAGTLPWTSLAWPQSLGAAQCGLRQSWLRMELQLMPGAEAQRIDTVGKQAVPFFGSATNYYTLAK